MIESKVKNDPSILMKNKGKMAALILGEIVNPNSGNMQSSSGETTNTTPNNSNSSSNGNSNNIATAAPTARSEDSILSIVDKDIQEKIIDSSEFHNSLKIELMDVRRKLLGISDEEFERMKAEERAKFEKQEEEAIAEKLKLEQEREENETRSFFQGKSFNNGTNVSSSNYRVGKPMTSHYRNGDDKSAQEKNERKKKDKVPVMMY
ncbi:hypothetical protein KGF56_003496 [Candida oxycetoniae]|uniref:Uncharacterized protein n=1 Tax=Candida oxycetoniae TaxID=497107 RepID=A0AAI9SV84_9ASCO|nr:uncharacterized protein KGF56_003496 [Candida oxycetoniae]KAI3403678.2 hypothetical protein KGF56_003496 [Candida oxycetoniae]